MENPRRWMSVCTIREFGFNQFAEREYGRDKKGNEIFEEWYNYLESRVVIILIHLILSFAN